MFGRKLVRESEVRDCKELEQHITQLIADNRALRQDNDQLSEANTKLTGERDDLVKQVIDLGKASVKGIMLDALKLAETYMKQMVNTKGKADYSVIVGAIKAGEEQ